MNRLLRKITARCSNQQGFTLIEIVVASAIASMIMLMVYSAYRSTLTSIKDMTGYAEMYENVNLAISKIDRDLSNCYYKKDNKKICFICEAEGDNSRINFVTVSYNEFAMLGTPQDPYHRSDVHEVGYYLKEDAEYPGVFFLIIREENHYDDDPENGGTESILLENVISLQFQFKAGNDWDDTWDSREKSRFPELIKTTIKLKKFGAKTDNPEDIEEFSVISSISMN
ncbi:MAG TPA: type II secretion system protein GspJ [Spirochaetota bacterium]|nr:type II secretion system protein GspJ [Spirochaetota bacterium]HPI89174.1 type II secretion system protein GspJ [Spirochaetota bacterium]HPR46831.1 type II secretion system protein GspJ [Spirochaetota bacterium]